MDSNIRPNVRGESLNEKDEVSQKEIQEFPAIKLREVVLIINKWTTISSNARSPEAEELHKKACEAWKFVEDIFKNQNDSIKCHVAYLLNLAVHGLKRGKMLSEKKREKQRDEITHNHVCLAVLSAVQSVLIYLNNDLSGGNVDATLYEKVDKSWSYLLNEMLTDILTVEGNIACSTLDAIGSIGNDLYCRMKEWDQRCLIVFLLGHATAGGTRPGDLSPTARSKIGRCLAKLIEFPTVREDVGFVLDLFAIIERQIDEGENVLKISYAWAFANFTDALVEAHFDLDIESFSSGFNLSLFKTALKSTQVPLKGRYSGCRACGNVFKLVKMGMLVNDDCISLLKQIAGVIIGLIGNGMDYKIRWNAAHAVGHILENDVFFTMMDREILFPAVTSLGRWLAQSQNYKERIQCITSLMKVKERKVYGLCYFYLWERVCLSVSRLPVEECDNVDKFKTEVVLLIIHLISLMEFEDMNVVDPTIVTNAELLKSLMSEHARDIPLERLDEAILAKENIVIVKNTAIGANKTYKSLEILADILNKLCKDEDTSNINSEA